MWCLPRKCFLTQHLQEISCHQVRFLFQEWVISKDVFQRIPMKTLQNLGYYLGYWLLTETHGQAIVMKIADKLKYFDLVKCIYIAAYPVHAYNIRLICIMCTAWFICKGRPSVSADYFFFGLHYYVHSAFFSMLPH